MRLAIIAAAGAQPSSNPKLGERDATLVASRLGLGDLGFEVELVDPEVDLAEQLDELFGKLDASGSPPESLLFYGSCLAAVLDDGECFLCLDPDEPDVGDAIGDVVEVLASREVPTLVVLELRLDDPDASRKALNEALHTVEEAVQSAEAGMELIAALRPRDVHPERIPSRLTAGILEAIDDTPSRLPLTARKAYATAVQKTDFGVWASALVHRPGEPTFVLRLGDAEPVTQRIEAGESLRDTDAPTITDPPPTEPEPETQPSVHGRSRVGKGTILEGSFAHSQATTTIHEEFTPEGRAIPDDVPTDPSAVYAPAAGTSVELAPPEEALGPPPDPDPGADLAEVLPSKPLPAPQPPPPEPVARARHERRPAPPSERKETASVKWPVRRSRPAEVSPPKVVIGSRPRHGSSAQHQAVQPHEGPDAPWSDSESYPAGPSSHPAGSSTPAQASNHPAPTPPPTDSEPPARLGTRETTAEGPAAKRLERIAREALAQARAEGREVPAYLLSPGDPDPQPGSTTLVSEEEPPDTPEPETQPRERPMTPAEGSDDFEVEVDDFGLDEVSVEEVEPETIRPEPVADAPPPPTTRKKAADMTVEDHIEAGDLARDLGHDDEAVSHYKKGLAKLGTTTTPERAAIYVRLGLLSRKAGKLRVAVSNFDKALGIVPNHQQALKALVELEVEQGNWRAVAQTEERLFAVVSDVERLTLLLDSGDRWRPHDTRRGKERYLRAQRENPKSTLPLERLLTVYRGDDAIEHILDTRRRIADLLTDPREKAAYYHELGVYCLDELEGREDEGYAAFELALDADPTMLVSLEVLASALAESQEWGELERVYAKMLDSFSQREKSHETDTVLAELHHRSALLLRDHLEDPMSALRSVQRELDLRPDSLSSHLMAAELAVEVDDGPRALDHLREAARLEPRRAETYHQLFNLGQRYDAPEVSFLAASVSVVLGSEDQRESIIYREHRAGGVPAHLRPLDEDGWQLLLGEERDAMVDAIMCAIAPAVLRTRVKQLTAEDKLPALREETRQDLDGSTLSVVRSIAWASRFLAVHTPAVFLDDGESGTLIAPFAREQAIVIGQGALRGRSLAELAFLVGRHLALRLPEHELVAHLQDREELAVCFLAALKVVLGDVAAGEQSAAVEALTPILSGQQTPEERDALVDAVDAFSAAGGRADLNAWLGSVERCVLRAGLLMCGDLETVIKVLRLEEAEQQRSFTALDRRLDDLFVFTVSADYAQLRRMMGSSLDGDTDAPLSAARPESAAS